MKNADKFEEFDKNIWKNTLKHCFEKIDLIHLIVKSCARCPFDNKLKLIDFVSIFGKKLFFKET